MTLIRDAGLGLSGSYGEWGLGFQSSSYQEADLILPEGGRIHYVRTSPGTGWADAVFEHTTTVRLIQSLDVTTHLQS